MTVMTLPSTTIHSARSGSRPLTAESLWAIPRVGSPASSPHLDWCVVPVTSYDMEKNEGKTRLWKVFGAGREPQPLTAPETSSVEPALSPDGRQLAFGRKDERGKSQLFVMSLDGGEPRNLTSLPLGMFDPKWLPDGSGIVFAAMLLNGHLTPEATARELERRDKDPVKAHITEERFYRHWDSWLTTGEVPHLFVFDSAAETLRDLTPDSTTWFDWMELCGQYDLSPDGAEAAFAGIRFDPERSITRSALYRVRLRGGAVECITPDHPSNDLRPRYSPDGKRIVYGMQHDPYFYADRVRMMAYDRKTGAHESWFDGWDRSPTHWTFASDGRLFLETEDDARISLFAGAGAEKPERVLRGGTIGGVAAGAGRLFFTLQNLVSSPEVFALEEAGSDARRLTQFTEPATSGLALGEVRETQFEGACGEKVQMFVVMPPGYEEGKRYPLVQVIHGGPHGISGDVFHARWNAQIFSAPGYISALVNFQGSTSWGQDFAQRIIGGWGDRPYEDVMRATDLLVASGWVDETRMAAAGGSYGGYLVSWILGHTDRYRCIVNHAGVYDTLSQYASDWTQGRAKAFGGEPWEGLEAIDRYNPARFARGFVTPTLVLHGERDYRVPVSQGLECYGVLKAKGVPARLVYFPDENHWVLKPRNSLVWYREVQNWLARYLKSS